MEGLCSGYLPFTLNNTGNQVFTFEPNVDVICFVSGTDSSLFRHDLPTSTSGADGECFTTLSPGNTCVCVIDFCVCSLGGCLGLNTAQLNIQYNCDGSGYMTSAIALTGTGVHG